MVDRRSIGLLSASSLVVANMVGTGVFTTSGFLLGDLGTPWRVLAAWLVGGVLATMGALCYGALARRIPESGGEYLFLSRTLHPAAGYVAGWISLLVGFSAPLAAAAFAFGKYTQPWLGSLRPQLAGSVLLLLFALIHGTQVKRGAWVQNLAVWIKLLAVALFVVLGFSRLPSLRETETMPEFSLGSFAVSLVWISFSYSGWNAAVYLGGEVRDPEKNLPRSLLLGASVVTLIYLALNGVFVFSAPVDTLADQVDVGRLAAEALGGASWGGALTGVVALALITSISSMMMAGPRVYARMAFDGYLPGWLLQADGPPRVAILVQLIVSLAMLWSSTFESLLTYIGFTLGLSTAGTVLGLILLRWRHGNEITIPGWPWVPVIFVLAVLLISLYTIAQKPGESLVGFATMAVGGIGWWLSGRRRGTSRG